MTAVLTAITIAVAWLYYRPLVGILVLAVGIAIAVGLWFMGRARRSVRPVAMQPGMAPAAPPGYAMPPQMPTGQMPPGQWRQPQPPQGQWPQPQPPQGGWMPQGQWQQQQQQRQPPQGPVQR
jgi:hypothetical protein